MSGDAPRNVAGEDPSRSSASREEPPQRDQPEGREPALMNELDPAHGFGDGASGADGEEDAQREAGEEPGTGPGSSGDRRGLAEDVGGGRLG